MFIEVSPKLFFPLTADENLYISKTLLSQNIVTLNWQMKLRCLVGIDMTNVCSQYKFMSQQSQYTHCVVVIVSVELN